MNKLSIIFILVIIMYLVVGGIAVYLTNAFTPFFIICSFALGIFIGLALVKEEKK